MKCARTGQGEYIEDGDMEFEGQIEVVYASDKLQLYGGGGLMFVTPPLQGAGAELCMAELKGGVINIMCMTSRLTSCKTQNSRRNPNYQPTSCKITPLRDFKTNSLVFKTVYRAYIELSRL